MKRTPIAIVGVGALLATLPWLGLPPFYDSFLYLVLSWVVLATSWNILSGYAGYFSFGHGAFFGAGLYTTATLAGRFNWPFLLTLPAAAAVAALLGIGLGAVVFRVKRVRGELFALLTLAVTFVLSTIVLNTPIDGGPGVYLNSVPVPAIGPTQAGTFYLLALAAAIGTLLFAWGIARSRFGAGLFAIHDDEDAAEVLGVPTFRFKLAALALSSALAGVAGGIHALFISYVTAGEVFSITVPLTVVLMSVLGGTRHWAGPAVGATVITILLYSFTAADYAVAGKAMMGGVLIATILFMPDGILVRVLKGFGRRVPAGWPIGQAPAGAAETASATVTADASGPAESSSLPFEATSPPAAYESTAPAAPFDSTLPPDAVEALAARAAANEAARATAFAPTEPPDPSEAALPPPWLGATDRDADAAVAAGIAGVHPTSPSSAAGAEGTAVESSATASSSGPSAARRPAARHSSGVLLRARGLSKAFSGVQALAGVDVEVHEGEILGLLGPNGSGKSTFINVVSGHFGATGGRVTFEGREIAGLPAHRIAQSGIARTYQIPRPFAHMTVLENVALAAMFGGATLGIDAATREARTWLSFTGLDDKAGVRPDELNLHQRKFLELARALASRPRLVLLDEVLCGLTPSEIDGAVALIRRIRDQGSTIVFVEHVMRAVMVLTDRVVVFNHGQLLAEGVAADVMQRPEVMTAYLGRAHA
ncbi:MAG: ATP-binding cassette domain-containing protein [Caldimonas sp.]